MERDDFDLLLDRAENIVGQKQKVAEAIGIKAPRYSRLRARADSHTLNARSCFRLAKLVGETPQRVLRAMGKADFADALDEFYGTAGGSLPVDLDWLDTISVPAVATVAKAMAQLPESAQGVLADLATEMLQLRATQQSLAPVSEFSRAPIQEARTKAAQGRRR